MKNSKLDVVESEADTNNFRAITGSPSIDLTIIELCPEIIKIDEEKISFFSYLIESCFFDEVAIIDIIRKITNDETANFFEGIRIIIQEEGIEDIQGIETYIRALRKDISGSIVCPSIP